MAAKKVDVLEVAVGKKALRVVDPELLRTDPAYQRGLVPKHRRIAAEYDADAFGVPLVGQRDDGTLWVVDGQQRIAAKKILGHKTVRVDVFASRGPEHEARVFRLVNQNRTQMHPIELFQARLAEGDETYHALKAVVASLGLEIPRSKPTRVASTPVEKRGKWLMCVNTLLELFHKSGEEGVRFVLGAVRAAWPDDPLGLRSEVVGGLGLFYRAVNGTVDLDRLLPRLATVTPAKLMYSAGMGVGGREANVAEVIARVYKKRLGRRKE